jgi:hypothetical protein
MIYNDRNKIQKKKNNLCKTALETSKLILKSTFFFEHLLLKQISLILVVKNYKVVQI